MLIKSLIFLLGAFVLSFLWAPLLINLLYRFNIRRRIRQEVDQKIEARKIKLGTPIMGGLLMVVTTVVITVAFNLSRQQTYLPLFALVVAAFFGGVDDLLNIFGHAKISDTVRGGVNPIVTLSDFTWSIYNLLLLPWNAFKELFRALGSYPTSGFKPWEKIIIQTAIGAVAAWWIYYKLGWHSVWLPFLGDLDLGIFYALLVVLMLVGTANAVNITDGMDGLAGGLLSMAFTAYMVLALALGYNQLAYFCATIVGTLLAFLYFNIYPARFEMADVGSLSLGMTLAVVAILLHRELSLLIIGGVFVVEIVSVIVQVGSVKLGRGRVLKMAPFHHHFEMLGWPETKVTMRLWLAGSVLAFLGVLIALL
jgi:phospho-N-acetylmuramoyl-pentapeptide-transferase